MDHSMGSHPLFEIAKCARRVMEKPFLLGSLTRMAGFLWSHAIGRSPVIDPELVRFLRKEQTGRMLDLFTRPAWWPSGPERLNAKESKG